MRRREFLKLSGSTALAAATVSCSSGDILTALAGLPEEEVTFHVSTRGDDNNDGSPRSPFTSLQRAQQALRASKRSTPARVLVGVGTYYLEAPLTFTPEDSATSTAPITFAAVGGQPVTISGGRKLDGPGFRAQGYDQSRLCDRSAGCFGCPATAAVTRSESRVTAPEPCLRDQELGRIGANAPHRWETSAAGTVLPLWLCANSGRQRSCGMAQAGGNDTQKIGVRRKVVRITLTSCSRPAGPWYQPDAPTSGGALRPRCAAEWLRKCACGR